MKFTISWVQILVYIVIALIISRYFLAEELLVTESKLFEYFGVNDNLKYAIIIPLFVFYISRIYTKDKRKLKQSDDRVIRKPVVIFSLLSLIVVIAYLTTL
ncbi:hypothetical protein CW745_16360 [Psychromonas sp. psych-6C06]|nr:hypothetical protein CW745_16360 [Psychromonas sp. psych-6C06]